MALIGRCGAKGIRLVTGLIAYMCDMLKIVQSLATFIAANENKYWLVRPQPQHSRH
jgi:hypothetical protein